MPPPTRRCGWWCWATPAERSAPVRISAKPAGGDPLETTGGGAGPGDDRAAARDRGVAAAGDRAPSTATSGPAGMGLVGACDIVVAGPRSTFALTEARIGVAPAIISLTLLPKMSARAAARYYLTGETFDARTAAEIGWSRWRPTTSMPRWPRCVADMGSGSPQGLAASKALTTAAVLEGFDRDAERLAADRPGCSSPMRPAKACWRFCRSGRRAGLRLERSL